MAEVCVWGGGGGNYWAPLTRKRHTPPHSAQPQHTNYWAPQTRKRHQQDHQQERPTEHSDPTQHAEGRADDCPGPRKETATRRNVTRGVPRPPPPPTHTLCATETCIARSRLEVAHRIESPMQPSTGGGESRDSWERKSHFKGDPHPLHRLRTTVPSRPHLSLHSKGATSAVALRDPPPPLR